ncbi:MAG TPA: PGPGW domain-containing protein [Aeromicrobium sp.]|nr:PGPGW domain-containing protein [Aeromicrobium sp.]
MSVQSTGKRILLQVAGWLLLIAGLAALVLPGPGILALFAGMAILATQYEWAERHIEPVEKAALRGAEGSVKSWPRIMLAIFGAFALVGVGIYWGLGPAAPSWWPLADRWWLMGGWGTGASLIASGLIALALLLYSYRRFRT